MTDNLKLYIKNIPDGFPDDKFLEILKKQFETSLTNLTLYKHSHKFKNKLNKICFLKVPSPEVKKKVCEFFSTFELIDQRGIKHKLKVVDSLLPSQSYPSSIDKLENTISNQTHFKKFAELLKNEKIAEFKLDEEKYSEGIFDGVEETRKEVIPVVLDKPFEKVLETQRNQTVKGPNKKIIMNREKREETLVEANIPKRNEPEALVEASAYNSENISTANYGKGGYYEKQERFQRGGFKENYNNYNTNSYKDNYNNTQDYNYNTKGYKDNYNNAGNYKGYNNYSNSNNYNNNYNDNYNNNYNGGYNNNYNNNGYYNDGYYDNNYNKKGKGYYKK